MAVNPLPLPDFEAIDGLRLGVARAGIKSPDRDDLVVMEIAEGAETAAVFTRNAFRAAPVVLAERSLANNQPRYLLINTGNANAGTGQQGMADAETCCRTLAEAGGVQPDQVLPFSTGVIGEPLPVERICEAIPEALSALSLSGWERAAPAIMTTDTLPKGATRKLVIEGETVSISGISKGAGMIRPNMATMLAFVATDAAIPRDQLQSLVAEAAEGSFNRITVDGDTSTNDACVGVATGRSRARVLDGKGQVVPALRDAVHDVFRELAHAIVRDAEGATRFVTVRVERARTEAEALSVAFTVAESPLVKTALYAADPNWGRILAAVGRAGLDDLDVSRIDVFLDDVCIVEGGGRSPSYTEAAGQAVMDGAEPCIRIVLGRGQASERVWTCDFSHEYVTINAEYRT